MRPRGQAAPIAPSGFSQLTSSKLRLAYTSPVKATKTPIGQTWCVTCGDILETQLSWPDDRLPTMFACRTCALTGYLDPATVHANASRVELRILYRLLMFGEARIGYGPHDRNGFANYDEKTTTADQARQIFGNAIRPIPTLDVTTHIRTIRANMGYMLGHLVPPRNENKWNGLGGCRCGRR